MRIVILFLAFIFSASTFAGKHAGVTMPDQIKVDKQQLVLNGMALRSKFLFKVYVGGLYLPSKQTNAAQVLNNDTTRHMVMHWLRDVDKASICEGWQDSLQANYPQASTELQNQFGTLCDWMPNAKKDDQLTFTYIPGQGTTVKVNGETKGTVPGKRFADALFSSWIGAKPGPGHTFKNNLMSG